MSTGTRDTPHPTRIDGRRHLVVPGEEYEMLDYCVDHFLDHAREAIQQRGRFAVALSGGSTPKALFRRLAQPEHHASIDWSKVWLFWGDERAVPVTDPESNYGSGMEAGLNRLPVPGSQIIRMEADGDLKVGALRYEELLKLHLPEQRFDLVTLGIGDDGHTASLFPGTKALEVYDRWVTPNFVDSKSCWRMTLTFTCINRARAICFYVLGAGKAEILRESLLGKSKPVELPSQRVGTEATPALWIADSAAAHLLG